MSLNQSIESAVSTGKCKLGAASSIKAVTDGEAKLVVVAANCPEEQLADIERFSELADVPIQVFPGTSWDLGETVNKPFMVSAIAVIEPGDSNILESL